MANDTFRIWAREYPYPSKFQMTRVPNIVCELKTMSGRTVADYNGWKYGDTTIQWTCLENDVMDDLAAIANQSEFEFTFVDIDRNVKTINAIKRSLSYSKVRYKNDGEIVWEDVTLELSFPDCYGNNSRSRGEDDGLTKSADIEDGSENRRVSSGNRPE